MSVQALQELQARLVSDTVLQSFFTTQYGKPPTVLIGYKSPNANTYPQLCIVLVRSKAGGLIGHDLNVSVVAGVNSPEYVNNQAQGVLDTITIAQLIINRISDTEIGAHTWCAGPSQILTDAAMQHPFYEIEVSFNLRWKA